MMTEKITTRDLDERDDAYVEKIDRSIAATERRAAEARERLGNETTDPRTLLDLAAIVVEAETMLYHLRGVRRMIVEHGEEAGVARAHAASLAQGTLVRETSRIDGSTSTTSRLHSAIEVSVCAKALDTFGSWLPDVD